MEKDWKEFFKQFDPNDPKVKKVLDGLYKDHGVQFETDVYKLYEDIINVAKPTTNPVAKKFKYPLVNVTEIGRFIIYDIFCPGVSKDKLNVTVETLEDKTFIRIKGTPWFSRHQDGRCIITDIEIGDVFDVRYDITHYDIDLNQLNSITSEYKDGVLTVSLIKNDVKRNKNFTINIK